MNRPKRAAERGSSPPDKRIRPPERRTSMQDRYDTNPLSPPPSRKNSTSGMPDNVPTRPTIRAKDGRRIDRYRSGTSTDNMEGRAPNGATRTVEELAASHRETTARVMSPGSTGSDNLTPVPTAPPAPSMLPRSGNVVSDHPQQQLGEAIPTLASLRKLKLRKQAIANEAKSSPTVSLQAQLCAQQIEITQLKKERSEMFEKIKSLESLPNRLKELESHLNQQGQSSNTPKSPQAAPDLIVELEKLQSLANRVDAIEASNIKRTTELDSVANLKNDVEALKSWKETESKPDSQNEEKIKNLVLQEIISRIQENNKVLQTELKNTVTRLDDRIEDDRKILQSLSSGFNAVAAFKKDIEKRNFSNQLQDLSTRIEQVALNEGKTYKKATSTVQDIEEFIGPIRREYELNDLTIVERIERLYSTIDKLNSTAGQTANLPREQKKLSDEQKKLFLEQDEIFREQDKMLVRLDALEKKSAGPGFEEVETTVANLKANTNDTNERLGQLDKYTKDLCESIESIQALTKQFPQFGERLKKVEEHAEKFTAMGSQYDKFSQNLVSLESQMSSIDQIAADVQGIQAELATLARLQSKRSDEPNQHVGNETPDVTSEIAEVRSFAESVNEGLEVVEATIHQHSAKISVLQDELIEVFRQNFDSFKETVEQQVKTLGQKLDSCSGEVTNLKQQPSKARIQSPGIAEVWQTQLSSIVENVKSLKGELSHLQVGLTGETSLREHDIRDVKQQIASKADIATVNNQRDHILLSFRSLQDQYNNITTDDLHQKMVHWFLQSYPSNASNMLQQLASVQQDVRGLQALAAQVAWIQSQDLASLLASAPQLLALVQSAAELHQLPKTWARIELACSDAKEAITKAGAADERAEQQVQRMKSIEAAVTGLQKSFHNLNSDTSPFVKAQALRDFETQLQGLKTDINDERQARIDSTNELRNLAGTDHDRRLKQIESLKSLLDSFTTATNQLDTRVANIEVTTSGLRVDIDSINNNFIEPNRDLFGLFGNMLVIVAQLQNVVENLNQNLPKGPMRFQWHRDLNNCIPADENDTNIDGKGGKVKLKK